mgnify:CR=1 FL=1
MKIEKKLWITLFVFGLFAIGFSGWIFSQSTAREKLLWDNTIRFETKKLTDGEIKSENIALPEDFDDPRSILFKTTHTIAEVWLDGEKIYEYGNEEDAPSFMKSPGSCWHIVNIPEDSAGKSLEVRIIPVYDNYYGNEVSIVYGTRGNCVLKILMDSFKTLLLSCGILFASIICLLLYLGAVRRKRRDKTETKIEVFLNLGFFSLLIAVWTLAQCGFLQFLIPDGRTLYFVDYFSFFLFPVPFNFLLYDICKSRYHKGALIFPILYLANMAADVLLQCTGIIDIFRLLPATHVIMVANAVYTVALILYEARKEGNDEAKKFQYPMCVLIVFGMVEMFLYYLRKFQQTSILLPIGTLLFIIMLIWIQVSQYYDQYIQKQKVIYLQKIANMDMLTEAMNRNAYEDMVKYLHYFEMDINIDLGALSMGQKKKVFMSFALATNTSLLLMDEPTNGLDIPGKSQFRKFIASGMTDDKTILISTHQVRDIDKVLDHVLIMDNSRVLLNESTMSICDKLFFTESENRELLQSSLFSTPSIQGNFLLLPNESGEDSEINLELLFNATLAVPERISALFHSKQIEL